MRYFGNNTFCMVIQFHLKCTDLNCSLSKCIWLSGYHNRLTARGSWVELATCLGVFSGFVLCLLG